MNVITFGDEWIAYCETVSGGAGAVSSILCTISNNKRMKCAFLQLLLWAFYKLQNYNMHMNLNSHVVL